MVDLGERLCIGRGFLLVKYYVCCWTGGLNSNVRLVGDVSTLSPMEKPQGPPQ